MESIVHVKYYLNGFCSVGNENKISDCKLLKYCKHKTCLNDIKKVAEIREGGPMFKRGEGGKYIYINRIKVKLIMIVFT